MSPEPKHQENECDRSVAMSSRVLECETRRDRHQGETRRPVLVDALTVTAGHLNFREELPFYSMKGMLLVFRYFIQRGHKVLAFVPPSWLKRDCHFIYDGHVMDELARLELVRVYNVDMAAPKGYKHFQWLKYCIRRDTLDLARSMGGVLVSYFQYRPHQENEQMAETYKQIVADRLLVPTFLNNDVYFPLDGAKGRRGKKLADMLKCMPRDEDYGRCCAPGCQLERDQQDYLLHRLDTLIQSCAFNKSTAPKYAPYHQQNLLDQPVPRARHRTDVFMQTDVDRDQVRNLMHFDHMHLLEPNVIGPLIDVGIDEGNPVEVPASSENLMGPEGLLEGLETREHDACEDLVNLLQFSPPKSQPESGSGTLMDDNNNNPLEPMTLITETRHSWMLEFDPLVPGPSSAPSTPLPLPDGLNSIVSLDTTAVQHSVASLQVHPPTSTSDEPMIPDQPEEPLICFLPAVQQQQQSFQHHQSFQHPPVPLVPRVCAVPPMIFQCPPIVSRIDPLMTHDPRLPIQSVAANVASIAQLSASHVTVSVASSTPYDWCNELAVVFGADKVRKAVDDNPEVRDLDLLAAVILASEN